MLIIIVILIVSQWRNHCHPQYRPVANNGADDARGAHQV
jgi:hypothetical protein